MPDIAIEVIVTSGLVDKLSVYEGLGIPEVWVYKAGKLSVLRLTATGYETRSKSEALPDLDVEHLASFVAAGEHQTRIVKEYRRSLRSQGPSAR